MFINSFKLNVVLKKMVAQLSKTKFFTTQMRSILRVIPEIYDDRTGRYWI